jgi:hypothetical protein
MAQLIPASPIQGSSPEVIRIFNVLRRLPDEVVVCQRLPALHGPGPDFCLIWTDRLLFLTISEATPLDMQRNQQPDLFGEMAKPVGEAEEARLNLFLHAVAEVAVLPGAVLFPNLADKQLKMVHQADHLPWVGKEHLAPDRFAVWLNGRLSPPLSPQQIDQIRQQFSPEVVVPSVFTVRQPTERHTEAKLAQYLLDYDQEHALKLDLNLTRAGHETAKDFQLRLINGVAGSGKSLIVLYRAHLCCAASFPTSASLLLTHNRALIHDLRRRYPAVERRRPAGGTAYLYGLVPSHWPKAKRGADLIRYRERLELVTQIWHEQLRDTAVSEQMLLDEIDWYKDRCSLAKPITWPPTAPGAALPWGTDAPPPLCGHDSYHDALQQRQLMDWGDVPRQLWRLWHEGDRGPAPLRHHSGG